MEERNKTPPGECIDRGIKWLVNLIAMVSFELCACMTQEQENGHVSKSCFGGGSKVPFFVLQNDFEDIFTVFQSAEIIKIEYKCLYIESTTVLYVN